MNKSICISGLMILLFSLLQAQNENSRKSYICSRLSNPAPVIDGSLDDLVWLTGNWEGNFIQFEPFENAEPTFQTDFKILYDDNNLYVAIRSFDTAPDSIVRRLSRRDDMQGDMVGIQFDSYFDHRTGFTFFVTAAGVKADRLDLNDGQSEDYTWDPVWHVKTSITGFGWVAEMQIPLNQLRFGSKENHVWGLQLARHLFRKQELSLWQPIARNAGGWIRFIGEMHGISGINPKKQVEVMPYVVGQTERYKKDPEDPFRPGKSKNLNAGLDAKIGITNDLTLDLSVNPDFGQVEADPSEVNLTAFETFFEEKRPFFVEGRNIMNYRLQPGDGDDSNDNLFYSRRIGRRPQHFPDLNDNQYIKFPANTSILGAAKLTGKTRKGFSVGIMESFTSREKATIDSEGNREKMEVEPFTNYFAARVSKDFQQGNTVVGGMITAVNRSLSDPELLFLHKSAYSGGLDMEHNWKNKTYTFRARLLFSQVHGDSLALIRTQASSARYYQRPDANHLSFDSTRTQLSGYGGSLEFWKGGNSKLRFGGFLHWKSPGLEINDIGYIRNVDEIFQVFWMGYRNFEPKGIFRNWNLNLNQWTSFDFSGTLMYKGANTNGFMQFENYWSLGVGINFSGSTLSKSALRGGPLLRLPGSVNNWIDISTDDRKALKFNAGWFLSRSVRRHSSTENFWGGLSYRPAPSVSFSLSPQFITTKNNLQYVENVEIGSATRYISAALMQKTFSMSLRANLNLTPNLSIQYWGQPFISTGKYREFKQITDPAARKYENRFMTFTPAQLKYNAVDEVFDVDENLDGFFDYSFENPDYKALFFQSNLVLRWEYLPGSTFFLVWSQGRSDYFTDGAFAMLEDAGNLFELHPHNIFLAKISYRLGVN